VLDHIYEQRVLLMVPVTVPESAKATDTAIFSAELEWLVCKDVCIPGSASISLTLPVAAADGGEAEQTREHVLFEEARKRLPKPLPLENPPLTIKAEEGSFIIAAAGPYAGRAVKMAFYPIEESAPLKNIIDDAEAERDRLELRVARQGDGERLAGVVEIWVSPTESSVWWVDTRPAAGKKKGREAQPAPSSQD
jgi:DsbC/DsbD-like thiol-disulfide interchange protein